MALPTIKYPVTAIRLPSFPDDEILLRPYTTREEMILMYAAQNDTRRDQIIAIEQCLDACMTKKPDHIQASELPAIDIEYLFVKLRSISVNNKLILEYSLDSEECLGERKNPDDAFGACDGSVLFAVDLETTNMTAELPDNIKKGCVNVAITPDISIDVELPKLRHQDSIKLLMGTDDPKVALDILSELIVRVYENDAIQSAGIDYTKEECFAFAQGLTSEMKQKIFTIVLGMPELQAKGLVKCKKCGFEKEQTITGITNFFG